jgi:hypothetical protein
MEFETLEARSFTILYQPLWLQQTVNLTGHKIANISEDELDELRKRINEIKSEEQIGKILEAGNLLPLLKSVATMEHEDQVLYAMAIAESIQKLEGAKSEAESAKQGHEKHAIALPSWFKGVIDKVEGILDLIKKLRPIG